MNARRVLRITRFNFRAIGCSWITWQMLTAIVTLSAPLYGQEHLQPTRANAASVQNDALRRELLSMSKEDQKVRGETVREISDAGFPMGSHATPNDPKYLAVMAKVKAKTAAIDDNNRRRMKEIVDEHGWPGISLVGKDGAQAAWLLVQHSDADHEFQKTCLKLIEELPAGEMPKQASAYLTDRILVAEKKPQRYGTQMDGEFHPKPLEDPANVDKRRAEVGLPPLDEYIKMAKAQYAKISESSPESDKIRH